MCEAARFLNDALTHGKEDRDGEQLAQGLAAVASRLEPAEAAQLLNQAMTQQKNAWVRRQLAKGLAVVAGRLERAEAARVCAQAVGLLHQALAQAENSNERQVVSEALAGVATRLEPAEAASLCTEAARSYIQRLNQGFDSNDEEGVSTLIQSLDSEQARHAARAFVMRRIADPYRFDFPEKRRVMGGPVPSELFPSFPSLDRFCILATRPQLQPRAVAIAAAIGTSVMGPAASLPFLPTDSETLTCRLTAQDLVDMLKMPTCVGEVRRVILDQLGNRYRRRLDTHWDFVRYAQEHHLNLDFTTPPAAPGPETPAAV